jgi:hypothetical protein
MRTLAVVRTRRRIPFFRKSEYALLTEDNTLKIKDFICDFEHTKRKCFVIIGGLCATICYIAKWHEIEKYQQ